MREIHLYFSSVKTVERLFVVSLRGILPSAFLPFKSRDADPALVIFETRSGFFFLLVFSFFFFFRPLCFSSDHNPRLTETSGWSSEEWKRNFSRVSASPVNHITENLWASWQVFLFSFLFFVNAWECESKKKKKKSHSYSRPTSYKKI